MVSVALGLCNSKKLHTAVRIGAAGKKLLTTALHTGAVHTGVHMGAVHNPKAGLAALGLRNPRSGESRMYYACPAALKS